MFPYLLKAPNSTAISNGAAVNMDVALNAAKRYAFTADQDCYVSQSGTAAKADGSWFVLKGCILIVDGRMGTALSVLGSAAGGFAFTAEIALI